MKKNRTGVTGFRNVTSHLFKRELCHVVPTIVSNSFKWVPTFTFFKNLPYVLVKMLLKWFLEFVKKFPILRRGMKKPPARECLLRTHFEARA